MLIKGRNKSTSHLILESLNYRMDLTFKNKRDYENQVKGFDGETKFDDYTKEILSSGAVINDLMISTDKTHYQIDSLIIFDKHLYLYEIKNLSGSYIYKDNSLYSETGYTIQNPLNQADRKKTYLQNLLRKLGHQIAITSFVSFMNPDFYIYSLPKNESLIFPGQLENQMKNLPKQNVSATKSNIKLANQLVEHHNENYRPDNLPSYHLDQLRKGILCTQCFSFDHSDTSKSRVCDSCGYREKVHEAIYRSVEEFILLFPEASITTNSIFDWCGEVYAKQRIRRLLQKKFQFHQAGKQFHFTY